VRVPSPRALVIAGLVLLAITVVGALLSRHSSAPTPTTAAAPTTTAPPPPPQFAIVDLNVVPRAYGAAVTWRTTEPSTDRVAWGPAGMTPLLWSSEPAPSESHSMRLDGLAADARYTVAIDAETSDGKATHAVAAVATTPAPQVPSGAVADGVLRVDGDAFFPVIAWQECNDRWPADIAAGVNLFAGDPCTGLASLLGGVAGRALVAGTTDDQADIRGPGLLGWFYADEADARGLTGANLTPTFGLRFLTLTSHFWTGGAPLPSGRSVYPGLLARADVVGFDLYPLQALCRPDLLPAVFDAQRELVALAAGKPTYQWIEIRQMSCPQQEDAVTARTIRVESWLALAGGAHGLGFFPQDWHGATGTVIRRITSRIRQLEPALLQPAAPLRVASASNAVRASARLLAGAYYVIAVNAGTTPARVMLTAPALADRTLVVAGSRDTVQAHDGKLTVGLPPLGVQILVAPPA
jgi:hypothetical protein